jgi:hypothetical protein
MALQAIRGETLCLMVRRFGLSKIVQVATHALGGQSLAIKRSYRADPVTGITVHCRVRPDQREPVLVLIDVVDRYLPPRVTMAQVTLRAIFSPVNVGVAVLALIAGLGKYQVAMAILTTYAFVHPAQGKSRLAVIELKNRAKWLPTLGGMAIFAGYFQRPVGTLLWPRLRLWLCPWRQSNLEK